MRTIADARAMGVTVLPPDVNESDTDFKVVYTHPAGRQEAPPRRERVAGRARPADPLRPRRRARARRGGARGGVRGAAAAGRSAISSTSPRASTPSASTRRVFEALVQCGAFDSTLDERGRVARARVRVDRHRPRALARGEPRPRGRADDPLRPLRRGAPSTAQRRRRAPATTSSASPGTAARCSCASGRRSASTSRATRSSATSKGDAGLAQARGVAHRRVRAGWTTGRVVKLAGHGRGLPRADLQGRRRQGRVLRARGPDGPGEREAARARHRPVRAPSWRRASRCSSTGKVSFPQRDEDAEDERRRAARADHPAERGAPAGRGRARRHAVDRDPRAGRADAPGRPREPGARARRSQGQLPGRRST